MASPQAFSSSVRGLAATVLELFQVRLELLSVEAQEEVLRIGALLVYGAVAVTLLGLGLCFLAMLITVAPVLAACRKVSLVTSILKITSLSSCYNGNKPGKPISSWRMKAG